MNKVRITAIRQTVYHDLMAQYENPIEHACDIRQGQQWISANAQRPEGFCPSAWETVRPFAEALAQGKGNFYDGWMRNPMRDRKSTRLNSSHELKSRMPSSA